MRATMFLFASVLVISGPARAQPPSPQAPASLAEAERGGGEWREYASVQDGFTINFPGQPTITETTWTSQLDYRLPGRVYSVSRGSERYSVTVIDYRPIEEQGVARAKTCPSGNAQCRTDAGIMGPGYWKHDVRGAIMYATFRLLQRGSRPTNLAWEWQDMVEGNLLQLTNADRSRTFAYVAMHEHQLYIVEGTVPEGSPEPGLFQQSLGWLSQEGNPIVYDEILYSNAYHGLGVYPRPSYSRLDTGGDAGDPAR